MITLQVNKQFELLINDNPYHIFVMPYFNHVILDINNLIA